MTYPLASSVRTAPLSLTDRIQRAASEVMQAASFLQREEAMRFIEDATLAIAGCFQQGGKLIIAGNGGSLCDAAHFAEELTGYFRERRKALPALVLSEPGHLTCCANDDSFEAVFARGVEAFGKPEDIFIGLSTSSNSPNIVAAIKKAKAMGLKTIAFLGKNSGGAIKPFADISLVVSGFAYSDRIQEVHMAAIHIIIEMVERELFGLSNMPVPEELN